ncbi:vacuolar ATPase assembly integral membrane protein vma21 [Kalmusia sp. IMI 367209]|nr:vacuolar ATPase assembly integral membrane protein vma21 [Kalmusia sp. IMI 367209]
MATRRIVSSEKTFLDNDGKGAPEPSNIAPAVPASVIWKLLSFTFAMVTLPIGTYFFIVNFVFIGMLYAMGLVRGNADAEEPGNNTWGGALAAIMANIVLIAYIVMAMRDDQAEQQEEAERQKKFE